MIPSITSCIFSRCLDFTCFVALNTYNVTLNGDNERTRIGTTTCDGMGLYREQ